MPEGGQARPTLRTGSAALARRGTARIALAPHSVCGLRILGGVFAILRGVGIWLRPLRTFGMSPAGS
jgi:hypothetical protein